MTQIGIVQFALWCFLVPIVATFIYSIAKNHDRGAEIALKWAVLVIWTQVVIKTTLTLMIQ